MKNFKWIYLLTPIAVLTVLFIFKIILPLQKPWISYEGKVCDFSGCRTSEMNQKYNYWLSQAITKRNPRLCSEVEGYDNGDYRDSKEIAVYFCKARYGGGIGDEDYCLNLENTVKYKGAATQQYVCFQEMLKNISDTNTCDKFPTNTYPVNSRYECYSAVAERNKDVNICKKIPEQGYDRNFRGSRKNCLIAVGKSLNDTLVCSYLTEKWVADECIQAVKGE